MASYPLGGGVDEDICAPFSRLTEVTSCGECCVDHKGDLDMFRMCDCGESFKVGDGEHGVSERLGKDEFGSVVNK